MLLWPMWCCSGLCGVAMALANVVLPWPIVLLWPALAYSMWCCYGSGQCGVALAYSVAMASPGLFYVVLLWLWPMWC